MNRITLDYNNKSYPHTLRVGNDLKGYTFEILLEATGRKADLLFELLRNVDYSKLDNFMDYGISINEEVVKDYEESIY